MIGSGVFVGYPSAGINGCIGSAPPPVQQPNFFSATTLAEGHKDIIFPPNNTVTDLLVRADIFCRQFYSTT